MTAGWAVEPLPTCGTLGAQTAQEVRRACAATRTCEIAPAGASVRRAVLTCNRDEMIIDALSADGQRLWSLAVTGTPADRARQAAVWIARSDDVAAPAPPEPPPSPASPTPERRERVFTAPDKVRSGGLTASLLFLDIPLRQSSLSSALGVQIGTAVALGRGFFAGPVLTVAQARWVAYPTMYESSQSVPLFHAAARVGWGAPWTDGIIGAYVDVGAGLWSIPVGVTRIALPSIAPTLVLKYPRDTLRPYVGVSGLVAADTREAELGPIVFGGSIAAGVAWSAW
jgi:hypothetical protein